MVEATRTHGGDIVAACCGCAAHSPAPAPVQGRGGAGGRRAPDLASTCCSGTAASGPATKRVAPAAEPDQDEERGERIQRGAHRGRWLMPEARGALGLGGAEEC